MPIPSQGFVNSLAGLDPLLRVRWGQVIHQWVIDRKSPLTDQEIFYLKRRRDRAARLVTKSTGAGLHPNQVEKLQQTWMGLSEEVISAEEGRRVIVYATDLNPKLYDALVLSDMKRYGGYARFADHLEAEEARREADIDRQLANKRNALNKETFDMLNFLWRKKESKLLDGERDFRYLLHGRRTTEDSQPLVKLTDF